jgi:integrase
MERLLERGLRDPEVWGECKAQSTLQSNCRLLIKRLGDRHVSEFTTPYLKQVVADMTAEGYRPASIKRHFAMLSRVLQLAADEWTDEATGKTIIPVAPRMPTITVKNVKGEEAALTYDDEKLVFAAIDKLEIEQPHRNWRRYRMFVRVALDTGFRKSELLSIGSKNVYRRQFKGQERVLLQLMRYETKNDDPRVIPCTPAVVSLIPALNEQEIGGKWFPLGQAAWTMWDRIREEVRSMGGNIDKVDVHGLRHTCLTRLGKQGMDVKRLQLWAGHADIKVTQRYVHFNVDDLLEGTALLDNTPEGKCSEEPDPSVYSNLSMDRGNRDNLGAGTIQ